MVATDFFFVTLFYRLIALYGDQVLSTAGSRRTQNRSARGDYNSYRAEVAHAPDSSCELRLLWRQMQSVFKAPAETSNTHEQEVVLVLEKVVPPSTSEPVHFPNTRRASKRVEIASVLTPLSYLEICKCLGLWQEDDVDVDVICTEIGLASNRAADDTTVYRTKDTTQLRREYALDYETVAPKCLS
jgi:hypothetical protein